MHQKGCAIPFSKVDFRSFDNGVQKTSVCNGSHILLCINLPCITSVVKRNGTGPVHKIHDLSLFL